MSLICFGAKSITSEFSIVRMWHSIVNLLFLSKRNMEKERGGGG